MIIIIYWSVNFFSPDLCFPWLNIICLHKISWKWFYSMKQNYSFIFAGRFPSKTHFVGLCAYFLLFLAALCGMWDLSFPTRDQTGAQCSGEESLNHWTTKEVPAAAAAAAKSLQSCPTLCDPRDRSPPGSPVPGILQARTLEWAAIAHTCWKLTLLWYIICGSTQSSK